MFPSSENSNDQLANRLKLVREIEERIQDGGKQETHLTGWQNAALVVVCGGLFGFWIFWTGTSPIPHGKEDREQAAAFLKQHFPDRELRPDMEGSVTAPVAAVFHIIRHGNADEATKAIQFAAEQDFGYASPYVIERLENDDLELREAARDFLRKIAGTDYGPKTKAWSAWWNDPPRNLLGVATVGHDTVQLGLPIGSGLLGLLLFIVGTHFQKEVFSAFGTVLLVLGWFLLFASMGIQFVGSFDTCTFGGTEIVYHQGHGIVEGLEDAKVGGVGLWLLLCLAYVAIPFVLVIGFVIVHAWRTGMKQSTPPSTRA